jgi:hypothetical protein
MAHRRWHHFTSHNSLLCYRVFLLVTKLAKIIDRCTNYDPQSLGMIDCYGVISIWQPDNSGYIIQNNNDQGPIIAQIKGPDDFVVQGDQIYLIDITPAGGCANFQPGYCSTFQVGGKPKTISYNDPNQTPRYLIINTETGDERFYANLRMRRKVTELYFKAC